jgi:hypothetical protein
LGCAAINRRPEDADAQALRAAVILDELDFPGWGTADPRTAAIIVELKTPQVGDVSPSFISFTPLFFCDTTGRCRSLSLQPRKAKQTCSELPQPDEGWPNIVL